MDISKRPVWPGRALKTCRLSGTIFAMALAGACSLPPADSIHMQLASGEPGFVNALEAGGLPLRQSIDGYLILPDTGQPPYPAVVLLHTSSGQGSQDWHYAELLAAAGFAAFAVDSFSSRGVDKTVADPTLVSEAAMIADAYAALNRLASDPRVRSDSISVLGFSKGGIAALYAALERFRAPLADGVNRFAAHVAYYPWCGVSMLDRTSTGAPVLVHVGGVDSIAPAHLCAELMEDWQAANPGAGIELKVWPGAGHAFDHPLLMDTFGTLPISGPVPTNCRFVEEAPNVFRETRTGRIARAETLSDILAACSTTGGRVSTDEATAAQAWAMTMSLLDGTTN